jgi:hypothetical protein
MHSRTQTSRDNMDTCCANAHTTAEDLERMGTSLEATGIGEAARHRVDDVRDRQHAGVRYGNATHAVDYKAR